MHVCKCRLFTEEGSCRLLKCLNYCFSVLASATSMSLPSHSGLYRFVKALLFPHHLKIQAGIKKETFQCGCCPQIEESGITYEFGARATATLQFPKHSSSNNVNLIVWPLIAAGVALVLIVLLTFHCIKGIRKKWTKKKTDCWVPVPLLGIENTYEKNTVYLVASTEEDERMSERIRCLCHYLGEHGLTAIYYEYVANDHDADGPLALGMNRWVELQFGRCEFVLFVCTRRFMEEWNGERRDILSPLVYPCRNMLYESFTRPQNISRFAVLFMGIDHVHSIPPILSRFRQFTLFQVGSDNIRADGLIHYLLEISPFVPPRVVNFSRQLV